MFGFTDPFAEFSDAPSEFSLRNCNIPIAYSSLSELATVVIPIDSNAAHVNSAAVTVKTIPYHTSAVISSAIRTVLSFTNYSSSCSFSERFRSCTYIERSTSEEKELYTWCNDVTRNGQIPFCTIETSFPFYTDLRDKLAISAIEESTQEKESDHRQRRLDVEDVNRVETRYGTLNPCMRSLSSAVSGAWVVNRSQSFYYRRPFANVVHTRGQLISGMLIVNIH